jgi:hypothetical protein
MMMINMKNDMKYLFSLLILFGVACTEGVSPSEKHIEAENKMDEITNVESSVLQLNNGSKWSADENTWNNVAKIKSVINDPVNLDVSKRVQLVNLLQSNVDTLVFQCRMQGPDHDALHIWLEQFLSDLNAVKMAGTADYEIAISKLKEDANSFYDFFE